MLGDQRLPIEPPCQCSADRLTDGDVFVKSRDVPGYMRVSTMEELRCIHRHFCSRNGEDSDLNHERNSLVSRRRSARIVIITWEQATSILQWSFQRQYNATTPLTLVPRCEAGNVEHERNNTASISLASDRCGRRRVAVTVGMPLTASISSLV